MMMSKLDVQTSIDIDSSFRREEDPTINIKPQHYDDELLSGKLKSLW